MVLRFDIGSIEEAEALAEAVHILFLDVWEFTTDWVDIRLSKDVVRLTLAHLVQLIANMLILGPFITWAFTSFSPACTYPSDA